MPAAVLARPASTFARAGQQQPEQEHVFEGSQGRACVRGCCDGGILHQIPSRWEEGPGPNECKTLWGVPAPIVLRDLLRAA
jgi:hypothetical protein